MGGRAETALPHHAGVFAVIALIAALWKLPHRGDRTGLSRRCHGTAGCPALPP